MDSRCVAFVGQVDYASVIHLLQAGDKVLHVTYFRDGPIEKACKTAVASYKRVTSLDGSETPTLTIIDEFHPESPAFMLAFLRARLDAGKRVICVHKRQWGLLDHIDGVAYVRFFGRFRSPIRVGFETQHVLTSLVLVEKGRQRILYTQKDGMAPVKVEYVDNMFLDDFH